MNNFTGNLYGMRQGGFTLIELMIVVVIIGIISMIALPSFQASMAKGKRTDAKTALMESSSRMEQYYLDNKTYTTTLSDIGVSTTSPDGYYALSVVTPDGSCPIASCYILKAEAQGGQATADADCADMQLNSVGSKTPSACW